MARRPTADPLAPIENAITALGSLVAGFLILIFIGVAFLGGQAFEGIGHDSVCGEVEPLEELHVEPDQLWNEPSLDLFKEDVWASHTSRLTICTNHPSVGLRTAAAMTNMPEVLLLIGFLLLTRALVRRARAYGLFTRSTAHRVTILGWYVLVGSLVVTFSQAIATGFLIAGMVKDASPSVAMNHIDIHVTALLVGIGLITFGRVMSRAVAMQQELDATV